MSSMGLHSKILVLMNKIK